MNINSKLIAFSIVIFLTISGISNAQTMSYRLIDLGTLGGNYSYGEDINKYGHVTGTSKTDICYTIYDDLYICEERAFFYDGSNMQVLGKLDDTHTGSEGNGINDSDQVTGTSSLTPAYTPVYRAFLYSSDAMQDLEIVGARGLDINSSAQVAGWFVRITDGGCCSSGYVHAFLHDGNTMHDLKTLAGPDDYDSVDSYGYGINNNGWVTGKSETEWTSNGSPEHAFIYDGNNMLDIGTLGGIESAGYDINDSGQVTGVSDITGDTEKHAFLYSENTMLDIGTLGGENSYGYGINSSGQVVGKSQLENGEDTAFLFNGSSMIDLCVLTNCTSNGWTSLSIATSINDRGDITGSGEINGETHAFLILSVNQVNMAPIISYLLSGNTLTFENNTSVPLIDGSVNGYGTTLSEINVTGSATSITKVTITLDITHTWISDLEIRLISPSGTSILLSSVVEKDGRNYTDTTFDDSAIIPITDAVSPFTGTYKPEEPLALFNGENANGIWMLQIDDKVWVDTGTLNSWNITIE